MRNEFQKKLDEDKKQRDTYESNKIKAMKEAELRNTQGKDYIRQFILKRILKFLQTLDYQI